MTDTTDDGYLNDAEVAAQIRRKVDQLNTILDVACKRGMRVVLESMTHTCMDSYEHEGYVYAHGELRVREINRTTTVHL